MGRLSDHYLTEDTDLFAEPTARHTDPETSHLAAKRVSISADNDRRHVLLTHRRHPNGLTDYELAALCDRQQNSCGKRRGELRDAGMIEATDDRRPAPSGSSAIVWRITQKGIDFARKIDP